MIINPILKKNSREKAECICDYCKKTFYIGPWESRTGRGKYCSVSCFKKGRPQPEEIICLTCKQPFLVGTRKRPMRDYEFCSHSCKSKRQYNSPKVLCKPLKSEEAAWLAGFLDGEGMISVLGKIGRRYLTISIANTYQPVMDKILDLTGIGFSSSWEPKEKNSKTRYTWYVRHEGAESLLRQLLPYLFVKKQRAELAINFQTRLRENIESRYDYIWQKEVYDQFRILNKKGKLT